MNLVEVALLFVPASFCVYVVIIIISPRVLVSSPTEKQYLCAKSLKKPLPLPSLEDPASVDLSVVIPAYNEAGRLTPMMEATIAHLSAFPGRTYEIIIVDDGSKDATAALALSLAQANARVDIRVVKMDHNVGKGGAVRHGVLHARGLRILMVDADGASRFADLEKLWDIVENLEEGIALGSRAHMVDTVAVVQRSTVRNFLMYGFHFCVRTLGVGHIRDTQCGFKLFSREAAQHLFPNLHLTTWVFDVELLVMAQQLDLPVVEVPITWKEIPGSKLSLVSDSVMMLKDLVILRLNYILGRWKVAKKEKRH